MSKSAKCLPPMKLIVKCQSWLYISCYVRCYGRCYDSLNLSTIEFRSGNCIQSFVIFLESTTGAEETTVITEGTTYNAAETTPKRLVQTIAETIPETTAGTIVETPGVTTPETIDMTTLETKEKTTAAETTVPVPPATKSPMETTVHQDIPSTDGQVSTLQTRTSVDCLTTTDASAHSVSPAQLNLSRKFWLCVSIVW